MLYFQNGDAGESYGILQVKEEEYFVVKYQMKINQNLTAKFDSKNPHNDTYFKICLLARS
jgi:hypothetical protein